MGVWPRWGLTPHRQGWQCARLWQKGPHFSVRALREEGSSWVRKAEPGFGCWELCCSNSGNAPLSVNQGSVAGCGEEQAPCLVCLCSCVGLPYKNSFDRPTWHPYFKVGSRKMSTVHKPKQKHLLWLLRSYHLEQWAQPAPHFCQRLRDNCQTSRLSIRAKESSPQDRLKWCCLLLPSSSGSTSLWVGFPVGAVLRQSSQLAWSPAAKCLIWCPWQPDMQVLINSSWPAVCCYAC